MKLHTKKTDGGERAARQNDGRKLESDGEKWGRPRGQIGTRTRETRGGQVTGEEWKKKK